MENYVVILKKGFFWWRDNLKLLDKFKGLAMCNIQNGSTCLFWTDLWGDQVQCQVYPELFSFARNKLLSFQKAKMVEPFHRLFYLPLSEEAFAQLGLLQNLHENQTLSNDVDWWSYIWGSPFFSSRKAYKSLIGHAQIHQSFHWTCQNKHKVFFLALTQRQVEYNKHSSTEINVFAFLQLCSMH